MGSLGFPFRFLPNSTSRIFKFNFTFTLVCEYVFDFVLVSEVDGLKVETLLVVVLDDPVAQLSSPQHLFEIYLRLLLRIAI